MSFTSLKGFTSLADNLPDDHLRANIISFFDYGFLEKGNFHNVRIPTSGQYGGSKHKLELTNDPRYNNGQVWQGFRANWVWKDTLLYDASAVRCRKKDMTLRMFPAVLIIY